MVWEWERADIPWCDYGRSETDHSRSGCFIRVPERGSVSSVEQRADDPV